MDVPVTDPADGGAVPDPDPSEQPEQPDRPAASAGASEWFGTLRRSSGDRMVAGVAGGLAERLALPAVLVRAGFVLAAFVGVGVPVYVAAWVLIPDDRGGRVLGRSAGRDLLALAALVLAGIMLVAQVGEVSAFRMAWRLAPWALALAGLMMILRRDERPSDRAAGVAAPPDPAVDPSTPVGPPRAAPDPVGATLAGSPRVAAAPAERRPRQRPFVGPLTWCAVLVVCGLLGVIALAGGVEAVSPGVIAAVALVLFGAGLVVSAFYGRARGLILPALVLAVALGSLGALDLRADVVGMPYTERIVDEADLPDELVTTVGSSSVDFRNLTLSEDRTVRIEHFAGRLVVELPTEVNAIVEVQNPIGIVEVLRPSRVDAVMSDSDLATRWTEAGFPEPGDPLDADLAISDWWWVDGGNTRTSTFSAERVHRTFQNGAEHTLRLEVRLGGGQLELRDPHWADDGDLVEPVQLCTVGGGRRGVVEPCGDVAADQRVALCLNDNWLMVDCREDRDGSVEHPRIAACRGFVGEERDCAELGIEPVGAVLVTTSELDHDELDPDGQDDVDPDGVPPSTSPTIAPADAESPDAAVSTVPVPETGGGS